MGDERTLDTLLQVPGAPMPPGVVPRDVKKKAVEDTVDWLRKNGPPSDELDVPVVEALSNITGVPMPKKMTPSEKKKFLEDTVDWVRKNELDVPVVEALSNLTGVPMPKKMTPTEKKKFLED